MLFYLLLNHSELVLRMGLGKWVDEGLSNAVKCCIQLMLVLLKFSSAAGFSQCWLIINTQLICLRIFSCEVLIAHANGVIL